ncbi:hypothetical protein [uncultured Flavobacterium sp.]|uniref:hypothetical protein n=1 Tax=uncultured Flavobacterium sp. TaxID=165435 RepID=UPI0030C7DA7E
MFQLYKKRGFNELVGDTFDFFKIHGKNYFKNYFIINGGFLLILVVLLYFFTKIFFESIFASINNGQNGENLMLNNLTSNLPILIIGGISMFFLIVLISIINYTYPIGYLSLIESKKELNIKNLIGFIKSKIGKTILFFLASLIIFLPIFVIVLGLLFGLMFILIGFPLMLLVLPAMVSWVSLSFYDYISSDNGYLTSLINGFKLLKEKIWPIIGSTVIMFVIVQIVVGVVYFVPYIIGMASVFINPEALQGNQQQTIETLSFMTIMMTIAMIVSILFNYTLQNLIFINQGIIYYSSKEELENNVIKNDIDLIGSESE